MEIPAAYAKTADWLESILSNVSEGDLAKPTPCAEWDVKALANHAIGGPYFFASVMNRETPPEGDAPDFTEGGDLGSKFRQAAEAFKASMAADGAFEGTVVAPFGEMPAPAFAGIGLLDQVAHGWDLAKATGQSTEIPADVLELVDPMARQALDGFPRGPQLFEEPVPVADDASPTDRFVAFLGRQP